MGNLDLWDKVADIDPKYTKPITGKDYKGTSPAPHYIIKLATEHLGPVGHGFGWDVVGEGFQPLGNSCVLHWCRVRLWYKLPGGNDIGSFEAYGQTKAFYVTSSGKERSDEDAPKKSMTDAVVKALAQVGFAANIFLGRWDDSKYVADVAAEFRERDKAEDEARRREALEREVVNKLEAIKGVNNLEELRAFWTGLDREVQRDDRIIAAKDDRKMDLETRAEQDAPGIAAE